MKNKLKENLPIIVRTDVEQTKFDMDAVDAEVYCVNITDQEFFISTSSESFTTIDEESGDTASHGSNSVSKKLSPGEFFKIAEVKGWEWDGHVGIEVSFKQNENVITKSYNLKESKSDFTISKNKKGRIISPQR
jgi:hypothetical protein